MLELRLVVNMSKNRVLQFSILNPVTGAATGDFFYMQEDNILHLQSVPIPAGVTVAAASSWTEGHQPPNITMSADAPVSMPVLTQVYDVTANALIGGVTSYSGTTLSVDGLRINSSGSSDVLFFSVGTPTETGLQVFSQPQLVAFNGTLLLAGSVTEVLNIIGSSEFTALTLVSNGSTIYVRTSCITDFFPSNYGVYDGVSQSNSTVRVMLTDNFYFDVSESEAIIAAAIGNTNIVT
jgi:hypothetical protein